MNLKKKTTVEKISESEKSALYSISFEKDGTTEFEKFVAEFEQNFQQGLPKDNSSSTSHIESWSIGTFFPSGREDEGQCCCDSNRRRKIAIILPAFIRTDSYS